LHGVDRACRAHDTADIPDRRNARGRIGAGPGRRARDRPDGRQDACGQPGVVIMKQPSRALRFSAGFTALEMLIVIAVLLILIGTGAPALSGMVVTQQLKNASFDLSSSLNLARSEALT